MEAERNEVNSKVTELCKEKVNLSLIRTYVHTYIYIRLMMFCVNSKFVNIHISNFWRRSVTC